MDNKEVTKEVLDLRNQLHRKIVSKMKSFGFCTAPIIVEYFKRWYLWDFHNVETSRSLSIQGLKDALQSLNQVNKQTAIKMIITKYSNCNSDRDILHCSIGQQKKIQAVGHFKIGLDKNAIKKYAEETLSRNVFLYDITIAEAHHLIERLEKWEAKNLKKRAS